MEIAEKIIKNARQILENNNVKLTSENGGFSYKDFGNVSINFNINIDISHIKNFYDALQKLTDYDNSPISDDGYTAIDIHAPYSGDVVYYIMEYDYIFIKHREISISLLKENCDNNMVDNIIKKMDHLYNLGIKVITLSYSSLMQEQFQNRVDDAANEITAGYYDLEDEEILKIKYKIMSIG